MAYGDYGHGDYGAGDYQPLVAEPNSLSVPITLDPPSVVLEGTAAPDGIAVPIALDPPTVVGPASPDGIDIPVNLDGPSIGYAPETPTHVEAPFPRLPDELTRPPMHLLGIGPWSPTVEWIGAANYGVDAGKRSSAPVVAMPPAISKSFTLRLGDGSEARAEFSFPRTRLAIPEEMNTDLWWQRVDPNTGVIETIGRFNVSQADMSINDSLINVAVQLQDYRSLLADRLVMKYKDTVNSENLWNTGTPVVEIMRFAVPQNLLLDLTEIQADFAGIGGITTPFELPLGSTVGEVFTNLLEISARPWEWWVEQPTDLNERPRLRLSSAPRGNDNGVTLVDFGIGSSPIASWSRHNYSERYANALYFIGRDGGAVAQLDHDIELYGQRDASDSDSSVPGTIDNTGLPTQLDNAAKRRVLAMADRRPTFVITLRRGYWRGRHHIDVGDTVNVLIVCGRETLTGTYRVTEIQVDVNDLGDETVQLTLGTPLTSGDPRSRRSAVARVVRRLKNYERKRREA